MYKFEVRQIEGWNTPDGWYWNNSFYIGSFTTKSESTEGQKQSFTRFLRKNGITFKLNRTLIEDNIDYFEIIDRKTKEPLFAAIYREQ